MFKMRRTTGWLLVALIAVATVICICAPTEAQTADELGSCCHQKKTDQPHPGQDCPTCSWSVLRSARLQQTPTITNPTLAIHASALPTITAPFVVSQFAMQPCVCESPPPPPTLFDLHCQLLS